MKIKHSYTNTNLIKPIKKYTFAFVCQKGRLEIEALFLAASLKRFLKCEYELIAIAPGPNSVFGEPSEIAIDLLKKMGVRIEYINNDLVSDLKAKHPDVKHLPRIIRSIFYSNKFLCFKPPINSDKLIYLDSDIILYEEFYGDIALSIPLNARIGGLGDCISVDGNWDKIFRLTNAKMPNIRIKNWERKNKNPTEYNYTPPHFNGGFIGVNAEYVNKFYKVWLKCYKKIISKNLVGNKLFSEQIALSIAIHKMDIPYNILNHDFPKMPFLHYFSNIDRITKKPEIYSLFVSILEEYPEIKELIQTDKTWYFNHFLNI